MREGDLPGTNLVAGHVSLERFFKLKMVKSLPFLSCLLSLVSWNCV